MTFPQTPLPIRVDISLDGTTWTDITSDVRAENQIRIDRGRANWASAVEAGRCSFTLDNNTGKYSPRNPEGVYYGQIGRNTPVRVSVGTGSVALDLPGDTDDYASTPDTAALDVTGDIDVRLDATLLNWILPGYPSSGASDYSRTELIGKYASSQRSWALFVRRSRLFFSWSTNGTSETNTAECTEDLPLTTSGRLAVRVTLDVDNGAAGNTATFYTSDSISGTWTQLGSAVTASGTTSIFSGSSSLKIGDATHLTYNPALGRVHAAQVRSGIGGSIVANPDFTAQSSGTTSFTDSAGLTWTLNSNASITNRKVRFVGEIASWTPRWETRFDVVCDVEAAGVLRRLGVGAVPTKSPFYREFTSSGRVAAGIVAYWPMEDGAGASSLASGFSGQPSMTFSGSVTLAAYSDWVASDAIPTVGTGSLRVSVPPYTLSSGSWTKVGFFVKVPAAGVVSTQRLISFTQSGTARTWSVYVNTSGNLDVRAYDVEGTQIHASGFGSQAVNGVEKYIILQLSQSGSDVSYSLLTVDIAASLLTAIPDNNASINTVSGTVASYTTGVVSQIRFGEDGAMNGTAIGHLAVGNTTGSFSGSAGAIVGWNAEEAPSRIGRIGTEEGLHSYPTGPGDEQCGPQPRGTALDIARAAAEVDEGILCEQRRVLGLRHVTRASMYNQPAALTLAYSGADGLVAPLAPVDDDQSVTNDVTVARTSGSSARTTLDTGALSTAAPPDGIGLYDTSYTLNLLDDSQPQHHAGWRLHVGTWDETRYPQVTVNLAAAPASIENAAAVDVGSRLAITGLPSWLPPDDLSLRVEGYSEVMDQFTWTVVYNCSPHGPWTVAVADDATYGRADTEGAELAAAMTSAATTAYVLTTSGPVWTTDAAQYSFDVRCSGEVWTATACTSWLKDLFGRTVASGWGTPDTGSAWTVSGGSASDYAVGSGYGSATLATVDTSRRTSVTAVSPDFEILCDITTSALATGDSLYGAVTGRMLDSSNMYMARVAFTSANTIIVSLRRMVADVQTELGTYTLPNTHVAGTFMRMRWQADGSAFRVRAWMATASEPSQWHIEATDTSITAANSIGTRSIRVTGNTNAASVAIRYDNFEVVNPQTMTVTRSVNGVVKAQSAGASVALDQPAIAAL